MKFPEYALRTSLVYNSRVKYDNLKGTVDLTELPPVRAFFGSATSVFGSADAPGLAGMEGADRHRAGLVGLRFGQMDQLERSAKHRALPDIHAWHLLPHRRATELTSLDLLYQDGWTITGSIGHKFMRTNGAAR